jgi:hypothetical protein
MTPHLSPIGCLMMMAPAIALGIGCGNPCVVGDTYLPGLTVRAAGGGPLVAGTRAQVRIGVTAGSCSADELPRPAIRVISPMGLVLDGRADDPQLLNGNLTAQGYEFWVTFAADEQGLYSLEVSFPGRLPFTREALVSRLVHAEPLTAIDGSCDRLQINEHGTIGCSYIQASGGPAPDAYLERGAIVRGGRFVQWFAPASRLYMARTATWIADGEIIWRSVDDGSGLHAAAPTGSYTVVGPVLHVLGRELDAWIATESELVHVSVVDDQLVGGAGTNHGLTLSRNSAGSSWASGALRTDEHVFLLDSPKLAAGIDPTTTVCSYRIAEGDVSPSRCEVLEGALVGNGADEVWLLGSRLTLLRPNGSTLAVVAKIESPDALLLHRTSDLARVPHRPIFELGDRMLVPRLSDSVLVVDAIPFLPGIVDVTGEWLWSTTAAEPEVSEPAGRTVVQELRPFN